MRYLVVDASLSGTGIRNKCRCGYLSPENLELSVVTIQRHIAWLSKYENEPITGSLMITLLMNLIGKKRNSLTD